jgi:hypothetical protein
MLTLAFIHSPDVGKTLGGCTLQPDASNTLGGCALHTDLSIHAFTRRWQHV